MVCNNKEQILACLESNGTAIYKFADQQ